ncbi:hypothetical protein ACF0H5_011621 [Mactra antiquata]
MDLQGPWMTKVEESPPIANGIELNNVTEGSPIRNPDENVDLKSKSGWLDFFKVEPHLMKFKSFFFFFGGAIGSVFPYFSIYYKQLGLSPNQIGIISGLRPLIGFCSGPVWGSLADRFRIRRIMLFCSALGWLSFITSIGFVPSPEHSDEQCPLVRDFVDDPNNTLYANMTVGDSVRDTFNDLHKLRPDNSAEESLMESRGWIYDPDDLFRVYITVMILVVLGEVVQSPCGALADSGCIETLGNKDMHKYGHQRAWGSLGLGTMSLIVGGIISTMRHVSVVCGIHVTFSNYHVAFFFFAGNMFCCTVTTFFFKFQKQVDDHAGSKPKPNPLIVFRMFTTVHYASWLFCMFFTGICNGVIWGFLFWHLENIGGTQLVLGVANGICLFSEMVMFLFVFRILEKTGCLLFMAFGLLGYTVRFIVFAVIDNAWIVLPFEILQGFTFAGIWSVYTKYLCSNVPSEYLGTLQGFLHGVYWGLGSGTGHMAGGILVETFGARVTFWIFAIGSFINLCIFLIIQKCTKRPNVFGNYEELNESKT